MPARKASLPVPSVPVPKTDHPRVVHDETDGSGFRDTRRTPGPAAGCNKPAVLRAEETVEVVQNHEGGTRLDGWCRRPEGEPGQPESPGSGRAQSMSVEGRTSHEPQERQGPGVPVRASARIGSHREGPGSCADASKEKETVTECRRRVVRHPEATPR
jgi:hypothetical protein